VDFVGTKRDKRWLNRAAAPPISYITRLHRSLDRPTPLTPAVSCFSPLVPVGAHQAQRGAVRDHESSHKRGFDARFSIEWAFERTIPHSSCHSGPGDIDCFIVGIHIKSFSEQ